MDKVKKAAKSKSSPKNALPVAASVTMPQPQTPKQSAFEKKEHDKWRVEDALRDIERAEKHKADAALMRDVKKMAKEKMNQLKKIC